VHERLTVTPEVVLNAHVQQDLEFEAEALLNASADEQRADGSATDAGGVSSRCREAAVAGTRLRAGGGRRFGGDER